jgi:predicted acyl esterase
MKKDEVIWRKSVTHPAEGKYPGFGYRIEPHDEFIIERDIPIPMRDNTKLYADLIRPRAIERAPVIVTYSPYGKHGLKKFLFSPESGVPPGSVSKYAVWEGPDPEYFVPHGYAVLNVDARGSWYSEGDLTIWSDQEAQDGYDVVEWAGKQPWSTGKVGMRDGAIAIVNADFMAVFQRPRWCRGRSGRRVSR